MKAKESVVEIAIENSNTKDVADCRKLLVVDLAVAVVRRLIDLLLLLHLHRLHRIDYYYSS
jgi:hypothetical protein